MRPIQLCIIIPAYNEEANIQSTLESLCESIVCARLKVQTIVCLNGCRDNTLQIVSKCSKMYGLLNIKIIESKLGKLAAQEKSLSIINKDTPILFLDADVNTEKSCVKILWHELKSSNNLIAVGAFPVAKHYKGKNIYHKILDNVLNIRSRHPQAEISKLDVREHHPYVLDSPQYKNTCPNHELKSKIFFHGRCFLLRNKRYWDRPPKKTLVAGDDSFLPDYIIYNFGKGRIRNRYDAIVFYKPFISILEHFKTYKRIYLDLKNLKNNFKKFKKIREQSELVLDYKYINQLKFKERICFHLFDIIRKIERFFFNRSSIKNPQLVWSQQRC